MLVEELTKIRAELEQLLGSVDGVQQRLAACEDDDEPVEVLAFVHIPKTAGGTVTKMLTSAYGKEAKFDAGNYFRGPEKTVNKIGHRPKGGWGSWYHRGGRVAVGHVPFGVFRDHLPAETNYMTFLREPVDRVLSHYFRHFWRVDALEERASGSGTSGLLVEAMVERNSPELNNFATRFLCGDPEPLGKLAPNALEEAKANLSRFVFVGIQERFDESAALLQRLVGLEFVPAADRHVSSDRPAVSEIAPEDRALIEERNALDIELYGFGVGLFEQALAAGGADLGDEVRRLKALSTAANERDEEEVRAAAEWLDGELPPGTAKAGRLIEAVAAEREIGPRLLKRARNRLGVEGYPHPEREEDWIWSRPAASG